MEKKCSRCGEIKDLSCYHLLKSASDGRHTQCKKCRSEYKKKHYKKNKERSIEQSIEYYKQNRARCRELGDAWRDRNRERISEYRKNRYWTEPKYRITCYLRSKLHSILKESKSDNTFNLIGCSPDYFMNYIESKFKDGMTWENYGFHGWHIDHIIPCNAFDLTKPEEQMKCFHYTNLQPLWAVENLAKNQRVGRE